MKNQESAETAELRGYMDELWKRIPEYAQRAHDIPSGARNSVEWLKQIGDFWRAERENKGLSRQEVAERMSVPVNRIRFIEVGVPEEEDLNDKFLQLYAEALESPEFPQSFKEQFGL